MHIVADKLLTHTAPGSLLAHAASGVPGSPLAHAAPCSPPSRTASGSREKETM
jgi:hypothetical protein